MAAAPKMKKIALDRQIVEELSEVNPADGFRRFKPERLECMKKNLPAGTVITFRESGPVDERYAVYTFELPGTTFYDRGVYVDLIKNQIRVIKFPEGADIVYKAMLACLTRGNVKLEDIQSKVEAREIEKVAKTLRGKQLPEDVGRIIGKFAATKKIEGGRKRSRRTRKISKKRRH